MLRTTRLDPEGLIRAISQIPFIVYSGVYIIGAVILATLSEGNIGRNWVFVDIGICALFGLSPALSFLSIIHLSEPITCRRFYSFVNEGSVHTRYTAVDRNILKMDHIPPYRGSHPHRRWSNPLPQPRADAL